MTIVIDRLLRSKWIASLLGGISLLLILPSCTTAPELTFNLSAALDLPAGTPVTITLPQGENCCQGKSIRPKGGAAMLTLQAVGEQEAVFLLEADLPAGASKQYDLVEGESTDHPAGLVLSESETGLEIASGGQPLLLYNTATLYPEEGLPDYYKRSGFIHPFYSPKGKVLTDGFPVGHTHQHGIFFAWVNTTYRGDFTDFWNQQKETGTVVFKSLDSSFDGPLAAGFESTHEFQSLQHGPVLEEQWSIRTYRLPGYHVMDITSRQKMIGEDTLFLNKYHYGGLGIRLSAEWNEVDTVRFTNAMRVLTSEGLADREKANHSRPEWTSVFGDLDGSTSGLALFDHPSNFRHPQPVRIHPNMPYFVPTPSVSEAFMLVPGQEYISNYRLVGFDGPPDAKILDAMRRAYAARVEVSWMQ